VHAFIGERRGDFAGEADLPDSARSASAYHHRKAGEPSARAVED
jgi:hypothetical protein